jgi:hypothetical protein
MTTNGHIYRIVWSDPFWGLIQEDLLEAPNLNEAVRLAPVTSPEGFPVAEVSGPDGVATATFAEPQVRQVLFLAERGGDLVEETVPATNVAMALDLAGAMLGAEASLVAFRVDDLVMRFDSVDDRFWDRPDLSPAWGTPG